MVFLFVLIEFGERIRNRGENDEGVKYNTVFSFGAIESSNIHLTST